MKNQELKIQGEESKHFKVKYLLFIVNYYYLLKLIVIDEDGLDMGPQRVFLKDYEYPGLAMSRSFGDTIASKVGVIPTPGIL